MSGDVRYYFTHGITSRKFDIVGNEVLFPPPVVSRLHTSPLCDTSSIVGPIPTIEVETKNTATSRNDNNNNLVVDQQDYEGYSDSNGNIMKPELNDKDSE
eukprot:Tbor_TRINITY_DN5674_c0_g2::TRINITY_DN5674_c0_g2_i1::g.9558::m.9558